MRHSGRYALALAVITGMAPVAGFAQSYVNTSVGAVEIREIASGLSAPWAFAFLPDGSLLVTERDGRLLHLSDGVSSEVTGIPDVVALGQGGLLDVMVPADFAQTREVWLTWSGRVEGGLATMAGKGRLAQDGSRLEGFETLFTGDAAPASRHFGARLAGGRGEEGMVFITTGDRGTGPAGGEAQDPTLSHGKVIAIERDGAPAIGNPGWRPDVFSLGHRNIQGAALNSDGRLLISEHGARGGDEINLVELSRNYGWPVISYGVNYNGSKIGTGTEAEGMEQPLHYWDPSIAPSGLMIYSGALIPEWQGDVFTGSLNTGFISRLDPDTPAATGWAEERITAPETGRVRDIREAPDGAIWFLSESGGALYRMAPAE